ncbi:MAG TPA: hypothetical protein VFJ74_12370, partial [Gemmatimonadaceae bacterium]|nr:hypothetical protein [Gemmatimonadaceae bacterium]
EAWDSVRVSLADSARVELLTFVHDTLGPRIASVSASDSVTLRVAFDNPLTPAVRPDSATYVLRAADSSVVPIMFVRAASDTSLAMVLPYTPPGARPPAAAGAKPPAAQPAPAPTAAVPAAPPPMRTPAPKTPATPRRPMTAAQRRAAAADSVRAARAADTVARADSVAAAAAAPAIPTTVLPARRDTTPAAPPRPRPSKSPPIQEVVIKLARPLAPGTTYRLEVRGARGILGATQASDRTFTTPKPEAPADSTGRAPRPGGRPTARPAVPGARPDTSRAGPPTRPPASAR